jgi:diguanylate cyclase (GGDEF)-like protein
MNDDLIDTGSLEAVVEHDDAENAYLLVLDGPRVGDLYKLAADADSTIGRAEDAAIRLPDLLVSRQHAIIRKAGGRLVIEDADSVNGTFRNGQRLLEPAELEDGDVLSFGGVTAIKFSARSEEHEVFRARLLRLGGRDPLTNTLLPQYFFDRLTTEHGFTDRHQTPLSCLVVDVDSFSAFNAVFGFSVGNHVLRRIAGVIQALIRREDLFVRLQSDRFAILCRGTTGAAAAVLAERLRSAVESCDLAPDGVPIPLTISVGVAFAPHRRCRTPNDVMDCCTLALALAKQQGRNRVVCAE